MKNFFPIMICDTFNLNIGQCPLVNAWLTISHLCVSPPGEGPTWDTAGAAPW